MDIKESAKVVGYISKLWQTFGVDKDTIAAWALALNDCTADEVMTAINIFIKQSANDFPPSPPALYRIIKQGKQQTINSPALAYEARGRIEGDEIAAEAWEVWGGDRHWGMLPSQSCSWLSDAERAQVARERKRYIEIYEGLQNQADHEQGKISHDQASNLLSELNRRMNIKKIV